MAFHIGKTIREVAKKRGVSQVVLAKKINTTPQNIQSIFKRETIDTGILQKISDVLEYDFFQFYRHNLSLKESKVESKNEELDSALHYLKSAVDKLERLKKITSQK